MSSPSFFTICSKNFTAYAITLFRSVRTHHPESDLYMILCDELDASYDPSLLPFSIVTLDQLDVPDAKGMATRYSITEFNTALKPYAFSYFFKHMEKESVIYLDPDILVLSPLDEVVTSLSENFDCVLTPHLLQPAETAEINERNMLLFGIYNLGFIAFRNTYSVRKIIEWWSRRLEYECVIKLEEGLFVDQKWADLFPAFIPNTKILHHPGYNIAYWNLSQRTVRFAQGKWLANDHPVRFIHFSGNNLEDDVVFSRHSKAINRETIGELTLLHNEYRQHLWINGHAEYSKLPYSFNWHGASGVNLHALNPEAISGMETVDHNNVDTPLGFLPILLSAKAIAGGWLPLVKRGVAVLFTEGVAAFGDRLGIAKNRVAPVKKLPGSVLVNPLIKIFVTDWSTPRPDQDSGSVTTYFMLKILVELGYDVTFVPSDLEYLGEYSDALRYIGVRCLHRDDISSVKYHLKHHGSEYSVYFLFRAPIAALYLNDIKKYAPSATIILQTVDLHYLREERSAQLVGTSEAIVAAQKSKEWELAIITRCDISIVISPIEKQLLADELPSADIRMLPLLFHYMPGPSSQTFNKRSDIVFIGGFRHQPNVDAVVFFSKEIWPLILKSLPAARFLIVGSDPTDEVLELGNLPGINVLGHVKDLKPIFSSVLLSVAPLRFGAGLKGKVAASLGHGVPVVATRIAVEGMGLTDGEDALIADTPGAFAEAVSRVYQNPELWHKLSSQGFKRVYELYSEEAGRSHIKNLMNSLNVKHNDFEFYRFESLSEYERYKAHKIQEFQRRKRVELALTQHDLDDFYVNGYCIVCKSSSIFQVSFMYSTEQTNGKPIPNWREHLNCVKCGFTNRLRLILHIIEHVIRPRQNSNVYITEQATPLYSWLKKIYPRLVGSEYLGEVVPPGGCHNGLRNEDMTGMSFSNNSFDLILSLDVLEHVTDHIAALSECYRCLVPGGIFIFTAPFNADTGFHTIKAKMTPNGVEHLINPPEYHGNPLDPEGGALCFRHFGWELLEDLKTVGFNNACVISAWSRELVYLGGEQFVFMAVKGH